MATMNAKSGAGLSQGGLGELKRRLLVVLIGIVVFRLGAHVPVPGLDPARLADFFSRHQGGLLGLLNMFSGGALSRVTVFGLGIMPYISSSIIVQMFGAISPTLQELKKEGEAGRRKINQYTRYGTVFLAAIQAFSIAKWLASSGIAINPGLAFYFVATITLMTGTMFLMWIGEQMTERGIGNGISLIIFAGIASRLPGAIVSVLTQVRQGQMQPLTLILIIVIILLITGVVVFFERAQRRITIHYAKRQQGRKMYAAQTSHLPLKINMSGVIPPIFASSILLFPATIARFFSATKGMGWLNTVSTVLSPGQPMWVLLFAGLVIFFSFFYAALMFNPKETADNLKKSGAFIPGIRPGEQTARYIDRVMTKLTLVGSLYLAAVALFPEFLIVMWNVPFYFGGTSLLIIVVVLMDFMAQVQAHLLSQQYQSLMKGKGGKGSIGLI